MGWRKKKPLLPPVLTQPAPTTGTLAPVTQPSSGPVGASQAKRGTVLGISAGPFASLAVLDGIVALGLGWVRISEEYGWNGLDRLRTTCNAAHARGLKVIQCVQNSGHRYDDPIKNDGLVQFAVQCVAAGADVIEIGNEWNHPPFWQAPPVTNMPPQAQANLTSRIARAVYNTYPNIPVITPGMSPQADPLNPWTWWPQYLDADPVGHAAAKWNGIGLHPYCYPELATTNPAQWNPLAQVPTIVSQAAARGMTLPVWITEIGAPGFVTNAPTIRGIALTEDRQTACYDAYHVVIRQHESAGYRFPAICYATLFDGQSATTAVEQGLGLIRADGTRKAAWYKVRDFALEPLPA